MPKKLGKNNSFEILESLIPDLLILKDNESFHEIPENLEHEMIDIDKELKKNEKLKYKLNKIMLNFPY